MLWDDLKAGRTVSKRAKQLQNGSDSSEMVLTVLQYVKIITDGFKAGSDGFATCSVCSLASQIFRVHVHSRQLTRLSHAMVLQLLECHAANMGTERNHSQQTIR